MAQTLGQLSELYARQQQSRDAVRDMRIRAMQFAQRAQQEAATAAQEYYTFHTTRETAWRYTPIQWDAAAWRVPTFTGWHDPDMEMDEGL